MTGVTQVEQDGFTSAKVGNKMERMRLCCTQQSGQDEELLTRHPVLAVMAADRGACVPLRVAAPQMQLVTQPIAHSYRCTELWLYNYVRPTPAHRPPPPSSTGSAGKFAAFAVGNGSYQCQICESSTWGRTLTPAPQPERRRSISGCRSLIRGSQKEGRGNTCDSKLGFNMKKRLPAGVTAFLKNDLA